MFPQATDHIQSQVAHLPRLNQNEEDYATAREYPSDNSINDGFNQTIDSEEEIENDTNQNNGATTELKDLFHTYVETNQQHRIEFAHKEASAIKLLNLLRRTNAPLSQYEEAQFWRSFCLSGRSGNSLYVDRNVWSCFARRVVVSQER